ncbi:hypothetical protein BGZ72_006276 [Mortierella alpina]|nr:hypothetical protein BGZ72_006276 [Mortierella alpina]
MSNLLQWWNVDGKAFEWMPENNVKARRLVLPERSELEMDALRRHSLPSTDFSFMLYDSSVLYGGLVLKASGLQAWEDAALLIVDTLYPDYWRSWSDYKEEWDAYEKACNNITSVPEHVVELMKISAIFNSCTTAIELRSNTAGYPSGLQDVVNALRYKSLESVGYGFAAIYAYAQGILLETDRAIFGGFLIVLAHDVFDYARD